MGRRRSSRPSAAGRAAMRSSRGMYVNGNTVRKPQEDDYRYERSRAAYRERYRVPEEVRVDRRENASYQMSKDVQKNREKAAGINRGYVVFLTGISIAIMIFAVQFLQLKSEITTSRKQVGILESQLNDLRQENDAYYSQVVNDVDMTEVKKVAKKRLGMALPKDDQIEYYQTARSTYVRQYQDVPDSK